MDMAAFREAQPILDSLRQRDCEPALKWCQKNAARLKRAKSNLEFVLRCQVTSTLHNVLSRQNSHFNVRTPHLADGRCLIIG